MERESRKRRGRERIDKGKRKNVKKKEKRRERV